MSRAEKTEALIESTRRVIERSGIRGATYRAVAKDAGESLGTISYYFPTLGNLIEATIRQTMEAHLERARRWFTEQPGVAPVDLLVGWFSTRSSEEEAVERGYVLYLAAISQPELRPLAAEWIGGYVEIMSEVLGDRAAAEMVDALIDACFMRRLLAKGAAVSEQVSETAEEARSKQEALRRSVIGILHAHGHVPEPAVAS